jgi:phosphoglycolate phosphatase-like HAD superfamily hydrolase
MPISRARTVLFWDIDGTLLTTSRAGVFALEQAALETCGVSLDLHAMPTAGLTDAQIAAKIVHDHSSTGARPSPAQFLSAYERLLPSRLHCRPGRVLPRVKEILEALTARDDVVNLLLTGNTRGGAATKLAHYGLAEHFTHGAFCGDSDDREAIARRALALAHETLGAAPSPERCFVIGDTPHDVRCGKSIGARTIAVATGGYGVEALRACAADVVLDSLPPPDAFCELAGVSRLGMPRRG